MWISAYALDFLTRAEKSGYTVPKHTIKSGLDWIENNLDRWSSDAGKQEADAYGLYVLTHSGRTLMSEILFRVKDPKSKMQSAQAWGQLAVALAHVGEKALAEKLFEKAISSLGQSKSSRYFANYGGPLRDESALLLLMQESALGLDWQSRYAELASQAKTRQYLSTQEMSLLLRVVFVSNIATAKLKLLADGKVLPLENGEYCVEVNDLHQLPIIINESSGQCWYSLNYKATPSTKAYAQIPNNGFTIEKKFYKLNGVEIDLANVKQNDRLVVVIEGDIERSDRGDPLVIDWIPAGFELENPHLNGIDPTSGLKWLGEQSVTDHVEYRNDRYVAVLSALGVKRHFKVAYVVRAVTVGRYTLPPAKIEDMYRPYYRALSKLHTDKLRIKELQQSTKNTSTLSTQKLTAEDFDSVYKNSLNNLDRYSITQLNFLRNSIFARAGFDFEKTNPMLYQKFSNYSWYHPTPKISSVIYKELTTLQKENIHKLLDEEKFRGGSLVLADFYRVRIKLLSEDDLKKYSKQQLFILRNSLFARHGVSFKSIDLKQIFSYMPWYHPNDVTSATVFDEQMSEQEKANVKLIQQMEKR